MSRGVLSGFLTGTAASTAVVALVSVMSSPPRQPDIVATAPAETRAPSVPDATPGAVPRREDGDPLQTATPVVSAPDTAPSGQLVFDTDNAPAPPEAITEPDALPEPVAPPDEGRVQIASTEPVYPNPRARAPEAPMAEAQSDIVVDTQPAAPLPEPAPAGIQQQLAEFAVPRLVEELVVITPQAPEGDIVIVATPSVPAAPLRPQDPALPSVSDAPADPAQSGLQPVDLPTDVAVDAPAQEDPPVAVEETAPDTEIADASGLTDAAGEETATAEPELAADADIGGTADTVPDVEDSAQIEPALPDVTNDSDAETAEVAPETPSDTAPGDAGASDAMDVAVLAPNGTGRVTIGTPATSLLTGGTGVLTDRLPRLRRVADTETEIAAAPALDATADGTGAADAPALKRFAETYDAASERPMLSIVLIDTGTALGEDNIGIEALGSFPYALTVAIDASLPDAADRAALYRGQGMEVMAMVDLPPSLTASDTEVALAAALDAVPQSVAVLEGPQSGLQGSKDISDQVSAILKDTGHGIIWQPNGLDTAQKLASRAGIPSQTLFRDFDGKDQKPVVIRRFLDQAAFKAGQRGSVVMVGRLRPETISALLVWGLQDRASRVAVAPVSAVLSAKEQGGS